MAGCHRQQRVLNGAARRMMVACSRHGEARGLRSTHELGAEHMGGAGHGGISSGHKGGSAGCAQKRRKALWDVWDFACLEERVAAVKQTQWRGCGTSLQMPKLHPWSSVAWGCMALRHMCMHVHEWVWAACPWSRATGVMHGPDACPVGPPHERCISKRGLGDTGGCSLYLMSRGCEHVYIACMACQMGVCAVMMCVATWHIHMRGSYTLSGCATWEGGA
ncbi:hypothetical protein JB92DRAFT_2825088 [Gautieria morchelliformis]|nr:hypothetical protein JB92DRAFT_2825088 [Gautieria morchelliformis]